MKRARFTESQLISVLSQQEKRIIRADICREKGTSHAIFFNWKNNPKGGISRENDRINITDKPWKIRIIYP